MAESRTYLGIRPDQRFSVKIKPKIRNGKLQIRTKSRSKLENSRPKFAKIERNLVRFSPARTPKFGARDDSRTRRTPTHVKRTTHGKTHKKTPKRTKKQPTHGKKKPAQTRKSDARNEKRTRGTNFRPKKPNFPHKTGQKLSKTRKIRAEKSSGV